MRAKLEIRGNPDDRTVEQMNRCLDAEEGSFGALMADNHVGYSMPIGGVAAYHEHVSPSGVGYDIGCGNKAVLTNLKYEDIKADVPLIMDEIFRRISFGVGRKNNEPIDHSVLDVIVQSDLPEVRDLYEKACQQLGTVGSGNHYVDLFRDEADRVWVGVHFGSRGVGHTIASGFLAVAEGKSFGDRVSEGEMDSPPKLIKAGTPAFDAYIEAMEVAGMFAYAGRDVVCDKVVEILGGEILDWVHNHHNFAWHEVHDGQSVWVVRKGATPAFPGQRGFIGATMGEPSVIVRGLQSPESGALLNSTVHGAGRVMSRTEAAGKMKQVALCSDRDCDFYVPWKQYKTETAGLRPDEIQFCPTHPSNRALKRRIRVRDGKINWDDVIVDLNLKGIQLRGAGADEAPGAYKRLDEVLAFHAGTIRVEHTLYPIGVAMAGADTYDPWKD